MISSVACLLISMMITDYGTMAPIATLSEQEKAIILQAIPTQAQMKPVKTRKLLVFNRHIREGKVFSGHPSIPFGNYAIEQMGIRTGAYETTISQDIEVFRPARLKQFDAVCFNNTAGVLFDDPELRQSLLDFIQKGGGFVGIHAAGATFVQWPKYDYWPAFGQMLGAHEDGGHPWGPKETITIKIEDPQHPINSAFKGQSFEIQDEVFQFRHGYSRDTLRVLLSIDTDETDMSPSRRFLPERTKDRDFAMSWIRLYGRGRVFYTSFGHNPDIFWHKQLLQHFLDGIQFALGDLEASTTPSAQLTSGMGEVTP